MKGSILLHICVVTQLLQTLANKTTPSKPKQINLLVISPIIKLPQTLVRDSRSHLLGIRCATNNQPFQIQQNWYALETFHKVGMNVKPRLIVNCHHLIKAPSCMNCNFSCSEDNAMLNIVISHLGCHLKFFSSVLNTFKN